MKRSAPRPLLESYRNPLEARAADQLRSAGIKFAYEGSRIPFEVPARIAHYLPDFRIGNIIIETKGWFGRRGAYERQKLVLVKSQRPDLDIRIVFQNASKKIYTGSNTTYAQWAEDHGFPWSSDGQIPKRWIKDLKREMQNAAT